MCKDLRLKSMSLNGLFVQTISTTVTLHQQNKKINNDQELIQSDPISCPQNQTRTRICFLRENWCLPTNGVKQVCTESRQVLVLQRGINSESKLGTCMKFQEDIFNGFQVQKGITKNIHIQKLCFCVLHVVLWCLILVWNFMKLSWTV